MLCNHTMRTLLRHTKTGLFFQGQDKWTDNPSRAYDFRFIDRARAYAAVWGLTEVEIAFAFEDSQSAVGVVREVQAEHAVP